MKSLDIDELLRRNPKINREEIETFLKEKMEQPEGKRTGGWPAPFGGRRTRNGKSVPGGEMRRHPSNHRRQA